MGAEDGLSEVGEINVRHGELQVPFLNGDPEGLADDLVTKADTWIG